MKTVPFREKMIPAFPVTVRPMIPAEFSFLRDFLYEAVFVPEGEMPPSREIVMLPQLRLYWEWFGTQRGDIAVTAEIDGSPAGAAWTRIIDDYAHLDDETPSLAVALFPPFRGQGIGTRLLIFLFDELRRNGFLRVSLSVQKENPAYRLYCRLGFQMVSDHGCECVMVKDLPQESR